MRLKIDRKSDTLYFRLVESAIVESEEVRPGIILDFDANDKMVGIEILGISQRISDAELSHIEVDTA